MAFFPVFCRVPGVSHASWCGVMMLKTRSATKCIFEWSFLFLFRHSSLQIQCILLRELIVISHVMYTGCLLISHIDFGLVYPMHQNNRILIFKIDFYNLCSLLSCKIIHNKIPDFLFSKSEKKKIENINYLNTY